MKAAGVSLSNPYFKSAKSYINRSFWYTQNQNYKPRSTIKENKIEYIGGLIAIGLAIVSFKKFFGKNTIPQSVVELMQKNAGLNKLDFGGRTSELLKEKILYPMKSILMGQKSLLGTDIKTGLIISDKDPVKLNNYINAFLAHAKAIGIHTETLKYPNKKQPLKEVHKALDNAIAHYMSTGECSIVNIGDLGKISNLKVCKMESASNIEKRLADVPKGVLWVARTTSGNCLPYFYNNLPTLSVKIVD